MGLDNFLPAELLHVIVQRTKERAALAAACDGLRDNLDIIWRKLRRIRSFKGENRARRIGVFGPPKRGKSTLLNELLGVSIMPTSPIPMSRTVVEAQQEDYGGRWSITVTHDDGFVENFDRSEPREALEIIELYGSHRSLEPAAARIEVRSDFSRSRILSQRGILIDTPGAEIAFEAEASEAGEDTRRALAMLHHVHVVLFCVRADQIDSETESLFYKKYMKPLEPLTIINFKDKTADSDALLRDAFRKYKFDRKRTVLVSAREAQRATCEEERQASGILALEEGILREVQELNPREGVVACAVNYVHVLERQPRAADFLPERIHLDQFLDSLTRTWSDDGADFGKVEDNLRSLYSQ